MNDYFVNGKVCNLDLRVYQGFWKMFHVLIEAGPQLHQHDIVIHGGETELLPS